MKKWTALFLVLCLLFSLVGCNQENTETTQDQASTQQGKPDHNNSGTNQGASQQPMYAVSVPLVTQEKTAKDGTVIFQYTYQDNMQLNHSNADVVDKVTADFLNRFDKSSATAKALAKQAAQAYAENPENWNPYLCQLIYQPMRIDQRILSLFGNYTTYSGARPNTAHLSVNYDLATGKAISFSHILSESAKIDTLCQLVIDVLKPQKEEKFIDDNFEDTVKDRFDNHIGDDSAWYLSPNGLCFYFVPYEIAPYTSGVITAEIPYEKLSGIIKDVYFPAELAVIQGSISSTASAEENLKNYTQVSELTLAASGKKILLHTNGVVYNIRITAEGRNTVFAASSLSPGDAIIIQADFATAKLQLHYTTDSGDRTYTISADGKLIK